MKTLKAKIIKAVLAPKRWKPRGQFDSPPENSPRPPALRAVGERSLIGGGRNVLEACSYLGSYGMGGPGFLGFHLEKSRNRPDEWLILCLWGACDWVLLDGMKYEDGNDLCEKIAGSVLSDAKVSDRKFKMEFDKGGKAMMLKCDGKRHGEYEVPCVLAKNASLKDALVVSPEQWLYV